MNTKKTSFYKFDRLSDYQGTLQHLTVKNYFEIMVIQKSIKKQNSNIDIDHSTYFIINSYSDGFFSKKYHDQVDISTLTNNTLRIKILELIKINLRKQTRRVINGNFIKVDVTIDDVKNLDLNHAKMTRTM
jgi:hypothetical protein